MWAFFWAESAPPGTTVRINGSSFHCLGNTTGTSTTSTSQGLREFVWFCLQVKWVLILRFLDCQLHKHFFAPGLPGARNPSAHTAPLGSLLSIPVPLLQKAVLLNCTAHMGHKAWKELKRIFQLKGCYHPSHLTDCPAWLFSSAFVYYANTIISRASKSVSHSPSFQFDSDLAS